MIIFKQVIPPISIIDEEIICYSIINLNNSINSQFSLSTFKLKLINTKKTFGDYNFLCNFTKNYCYL